MYRCFKCGYTGIADGKCPACGSEKIMSEQALAETLAELRCSMKNRKYEYAAMGYRSLAELGVTEAEIEYGKMLEAGELLPRDLDLAMKFFYSAAEKCDPLGAYRYSRLISRHSDGASRFWLEFSAHLGCREAYPVAAEQYSDMGDDVMANYYYSLAALLDDTSAIVTMAKRYYNGIGAERSEEYAKWYLDKFTIPPFSALKMAYRLRSVKAKEPPMEKPEKYGDIILALYKKAQKYKFDTAYFYLANELAQDDNDILCTLGVLYAEGVGCRQDIRTALEKLEAAAANGSKNAYKYLGDMYIEGKRVERDIEKALGYYKSAAELGMSNAYLLMGDIYYDGVLVPCDIAAAIELYDIAAKEGDAEAKRKSDSLKDEREALFTEGESCLSYAKEAAFKKLAVSVGMGYIPAYSRLAYCYEMGVGTKCDRQRAYHWYKTAVSKGDTSALYNLGLCYSRGIGTNFDFNAAISALKRAERFGDERAAAEAARIMENKKRHMTKQLFSTAIRLLYNKKFEPALAMLEACRKAGHPKGIYTLGCLYEFGIGTKTDRELAFSLYELAYEMKFRDPRQVYKLRVLKMVR